MSHQMILNEMQMHQKIKRIAYEIYENNFQEEEIVIAGIFDKGYILANMLSGELKNISPFKVSLVRVDLNKFAPLQSEIRLDCDENFILNKCIILTDDVLNTGRTLAYSLKPFLCKEIKKLETAVLINRSHKLFPVSADYKGLEISTTLTEHIDVRLDGYEKGVYLH